MAINGPAATKNSLAAKYAADATYIALYTADPGTTGAVTGEVTGGSPAYARKAPTWSSPTNGVITCTVTFDVPAGVTPTWASSCTASTGATLYDRYDITDQPYNTQGTYTLTLTVTLG